MSSQEGLALREEIRRDMNGLADHVAGGGCPDYADYQKNCGIIEGLARAERILLDLAERERRMLEGDDEPGEEGEAVEGDIY
jgi:hypothetical protein